MYIRNELKDADIFEAEQILIRHGISKDKVESVLQAIGHALLDEDLYPDIEPDNGFGNTNPSGEVIRVRNDKVSFLPAADASRIYEPYEVYQLIKDKSIADDIDSRLEPYFENEEYNIPDEAVDTLAAGMVDSFKMALGMNDSYWESYWMQVDSIIEEALKPYKVKDEGESTPEIGSKGFCIKSYMEDDIVDTSEPVFDFEEAVHSAMCFDCDAFDECREEYEEELGYEPSCLVSVVDIATNTCMFWANSDGDFGSDYAGKDDDQYNKVISEYM